jgi:hypothetical protein
MKLKRILLTSILVPACVAFAACNSTTGEDEGSGGSQGSGGSGSGGKSGSGGVISETGGNAPGGAGAGGKPGNGGTTANTTPKGTGGSAPGGTTQIIKDTGGSGAGGRIVTVDGGSKDGGPLPGAGGKTGIDGGGGGPGGSGGTPTASAEDEGADCTVTGIPDSSALTANSKLPDPFKKLDGTAITKKADWRCRREEIKKLNEKFVFGTKPPKATVTGSVSSSKIDVKITDGGKSGSFSVTITAPKSGKAPYPSVVVYGGMGADTATIQGEGVAIINYDPNTIGAEGKGHGTNQSGTFYSMYSGGSAVGLLTAWGWGVSRIIDVIEASDGSVLDAKAVGVTGCSRYGKGAFLAGVLDQRVALTMPIESGTSGVPIWRGIAKGENGENGKPSQSLSSAYSEQPWFADAFNAFTSNPSKNPIDTHELVGMVAPRGLFIMDNPHIGELSPKYGHVAALGGAEIYKALGAGENISYHSDVQSGTHCSTRSEWTAPLKSNIQKFLKKTGNDPGAIKAFSGYSGKLSDWADWTTPTLQ